MKRIGRILLCILMITVLFGISIMGNFVVKSENKSKEKKRTAITKEEMKEERSLSIPPRPFILPREGAVDKMKGVILWLHIPNEAMHT